jgi:carboxypeptidase D
VWDFLGFPTELVYASADADVYFNRIDTKTAMHSPQYVDWDVFGGL